MKKLPTQLPWILIILCVVERAQLCLCRNSSIIIATTSCIGYERQALLEFKRSFTEDPSDRLSSWKGPDCCKWVGVKCSFSPGHVVKLDLRNTHAEPVYMTSTAVVLEVPLVYEPDPFELKALEVNSCLLRLRYLNHLDLSGNDFQDSPIPVFFGSMLRLRYLNLSAAGFSGTVPHQLGDLTNLRVLDLSSRLSLLKIEDFTWATGLTSLKYLDMSGTLFTEASNLVHALNMLPSLSVLHLSNCGLSHIHFSEGKVFSANSSTIQELDISVNYLLQNSSLTFLQNMTALRVLDIASCGFYFSIPEWVRNFKNLTHLDVSGNSFSGIEDMISYVLSHLCSLKTLDMSYNTFLDQPLPLYENLPSCREHDLEFLSLVSTSLTGKFPDFIAKFRKLKYLYLSSNALHGPIPTTLAENFLLLEVIDLSSNEFNGVIPYSIGKLINMETFDVSRNSLDGEVFDHIHLSNLSNLKDFSASFNYLLSFVFKHDWVPPFQLKSLKMSSCKLTMFPRWLETQTILVDLRLSNASISGSFPKWTENLHLIHLDLSHNHIVGPLLQNIGDILPAMQDLYLSDNHMNGTIPSSLCNIKYLYNLDLSENMLSGDIPNCWGDTSLLLLNLGSNNLTGIIPSSIGRSNYLQWLHLNDNGLEGELPLSLHNCTSLVLLDLDENRLSGNLPSWIGGSLSSLQLLRLRNNRLDGHIPREICQLSQLIYFDLADYILIGQIPRCLGNLSRMFDKIELYGNEGYYVQWDEVNVEVVVKGKEYTFTKTLRLLVNMDLSRNNLVGTIPEEITNLAGLIGLNLSHNHLTGNIPKSIGKLESLESLDFSENKLFGNIPSSISDLAWLSHLNLASNNLSGKIPRGGQLQILIRTITLTIQNFAESHWRRDAQVIRWHLHLPAVAPLMQKKKIKITYKKRYGFILS